jgi:type IV secretion system protein VirD4
MTHNKIGMLAIAVFGGATFLVLWWRSTFGAGNGGDGARFAGRGDTRQLRKATGIPLGRHAGRDLRAERNASVCLVGPSQSGKTLSAVVRAILTWPGPLLVLSVKSDVLRLTVAERRRRGDVRIFDPTGQAGEQTATWCPVAAASSWTNARSISAGLLQVGQDSADRDREPHWREAADSALSPLLLAANERKATMRTVLGWVHLHEQDEPREALRRCKDPHAMVALESLEHLWKSDQRYRTSVLSTLSAAIKGFGEPGVLEATSKAGISPEWLVGGANTVYVVAPASQQRRLAALFGGLVVHLLDGALEIAQRNPSGRLEMPMLAALDEVCNAAPIGTLDEIASSGAGQGVLLMSVAQDVSQLIATFGREKASSILSNHRGKLFWSTGDPETHKYVDDVLGDREYDRQSRTHTRGQHGSWSTTSAPERRPLVAPHELRQGKRGRALLIYGDLPACWLDEPLVFQDRRLRELVPREVLAEG